MEQAARDPLEELQQLLTTYTKVTEELAEAPERLRPAFEVAVMASRTALTEALQNPSVQEVAEAQRRQLENDITIIDSLVSRGLLSEDQAMTHIEAVMRHPDYTLLRLARRIGKVAASNAEQPASRQTAAHETLPAATTQQKAASIALGRVRLPAEPRKASSTPAHKGNQSRHKGLSRKERAQLTDSRIEVTITPDTIIVDGDVHKDTVFHGHIPRYAAFVRTISRLRPGQEVNPYELWEMTFPGTPWNKPELEKARHWMQTYLLTSRSETPLLAHNGKRGVSSRYQRNPDIELRLTDTTEQAPQPEVISIHPADLSAPPSGHERKLMCLIIDDLTRQSGDLFAFDAADRENRVDFSQLSDADADILLQASTAKLKVYAGSEQAREKLLEQAVETEDTALLTFLETIQPRLERYLADFPKDDELAAISQKVLSRVRNMKRPI